MDLKAKWKISHQSICSIQHFNDKTLISSGTGFKVADKILTNNHVYYANSSTHTTIKFVDKNSYTIIATETFSKEKFQSLLIAGDKEESWDFALLDISDTLFNLLPNLVICEPEFEIIIGSEVYFLGFPLLQDNLTIHGGNISSKFKHKTGVKYIQIDASINSGNSGGALFDFNSDKIIGIVTRKNTGLTEQFDELEKSLEENIKQLEQASKVGGVFISGVNPLEGLKIIQSQLNLLTREIKRSSNVGIGYAFELDEIRKVL